MTQHHDEQTEETTVRTAKMVALPAVGIAAFGGALVMGVVAFGAGWFLKSPDTVEVARAPTADELAEACAPEVEEVEDELTTAQTRVAELERTAAEKEGRVMELEAKIARGAEAGKALRAELESVKAELAETKEALEVAEAEKERLLEELRVTEEELEETQEKLVVAVEQRDDAREDALYNRWADFLSDAQLEICDRGNRKRLGNCRESVLATLEVDGRRDKFAHCIRSGQAQPIVAELDKKSDLLPQYAEMIDEDTRQVKGWYVNFCDPTLPERSDAALAEGRLPSTTPTSG